MSQKLNKEFELNRTPSCFSPINYEDSTMDFSSVRTVKRDIVRFKDEMPLFDSPKTNQSIQLYVVLEMEMP